MTWEEVKKEMVVEKGLDASIADKIYAFVSLRAAPQALLEKLETEKLCGNNKNCMHALQDLRTLFVYLECYGVLDRVVFDMSLARGLDYYTGIIYEASLRQGRGSLNASVSLCCLQMGCESDLLLAVVVTTILWVCSAVERYPQSE